VTRPLHIVFSGLAAEQLREGLVRARRDEEVCGLDDNWSLGPIDSEDLDARLQAVAALDETDIDAEQRDSIEDFWQTALDAARPRVVWFSQWSTMEYCGFLEWLRRNDGAPFSLIDVSDLCLPHRKHPSVPSPVRCVSLLDAERYADYALWDMAVTPPVDKLIVWSRLWDRLRAENAPLRVIEADTLVSAPLTHFDPEILGHITARRWRTIISVVAHVLADHMFPDSRTPGIHQCGDLILFARIRALADQGVLLGMGDRNDRLFKVRRPKPTYAATAPTA
jgi:hypothetical protein